MSWHDLAEYARWAPSPHNTQPTRLRVVDDERAELLFVPGRGLPVGDPRGRFTFLTFGIFVESLRLAAHARGFRLEVAHTGEPLYRGTDAVEKVAELRLVWCGAPIPDLDPELLLRRRTNRHPYNDAGVSKDVVDELQEEARRHGHAFSVSTDARVIRSVKELNHRCLAHELTHADYREELGSWLRYSEAQARRARDGLSPRTLALPGLLLRGVMRAHGLFSAPVVRAVTKRMYLRTMDGISTVGWISGPFADAADWTAAGSLLLRLWLILTDHGVDWQPYGSIITNDDSRRSVAAELGVQEGEGGLDMVWLIARMGYSDAAPAGSRRLALAEIVR